MARTIEEKIKAIEWAIERNLDSMIYIQNSNLIEKEIRDKQVEAHRSYQSTLFAMLAELRKKAAGEGVGG